MQTLIDRAWRWGFYRGLHKTGSLSSQLVKLMEETGELAAAVAREDHKKIVDAVGDILVVLVQFGAIHNRDCRGADPSQYLHECLANVLNVIEARTGQTKNGFFVKDGE